MNWSKARLDSLLPEDFPTTQAGSCVTLSLSPPKWSGNSRTRHEKLSSGTHVWKDVLLDLLSACEATVWSWFTESYSIMANPKDVSNLARNAAVS